MILPPFANEPECERRMIFNMRATRSLRRVSGALRDLDIPHAPAKGVVLARTIYDDVTDRPFIDVDVLVPRAEFPRAVETLVSHGWPLRFSYPDIREAQFAVEGVAVELHGEIGRRDLSHLTTSDFFARSREDNTTFGFPVTRLDDVDHFLLLVANVVKDGFNYSNTQRSGDLSRLLPYVTARFPEMVSRATEGAFLTAVVETAVWMAEVHRSIGFAGLVTRLPAPNRRVFAKAVRLHRRLTKRQSRRKSSLSGLTGMALAAWMPDDRGLRRRGLGRLVGRGRTRLRGGVPG